MSVVFDFSLDEVQLAEMIADGYTSLTLWYASSPDGVYANSAATVVPASLAAAVTAEDFTFTFTYAAGNGAQWFKILPYTGAVYGPLSDAKPFSGGGGTTLAVLIAQLGELLGDRKESTTTAAGSTTSFVCNDINVARHPDKFYKNWTFLNQANDEWSPISNWVRATKTGTLEFTLTSIGSGVSIAVFQRWDKSQYRNAINWAIVNSYPILNQPIDYRGLLTADDTFEFLIPGNIRVVNQVMVESSNNSTSTVQATRGHPWRNLPYKVMGDGLLQRLEFKIDPFEDSGDTARRLRILGEGSLSQLYNDSDYVEAIEPQTELILFLAAAYLYRLLIPVAASSDIERYQTLANWWEGRYMAYVDQFPSGRRPDNYFSHDALWRNSRTSPRPDWRVAG